MKRTLAAVVFAVSAVSFCAASAWCQETTVWEIGQESACQTAESTVKLPSAIVDLASLCNAVEDNLRYLTVTHNALRLTFRLHEVLTICLNHDLRR
jgi:hypothetical protein